MMSTQLIELDRSAAIVDSLPVLDSVCATVWIAHGSRDEAPDRHGAAHLVEHLVNSTGTRQDGGGFMRVVDAAGGRTKVLTTPEFTVYGFTTSAEWWLESWHALTHQVATVGADGPLVERQRRVVRNEIADAADDIGRAAHQVAIRDLLGDHPLARPAMGTDREIAALTPQALRAHIDAAHVRNNVTIVFSGAVDPCRATEEAASFVQALPVGEERTCLRTRPIPRRGRIRHAADQRRAHVLTSWMIPLEEPIDTATLGVLNRVMGGGVQGRLKERFAGADGSYSLYSYRSTFSDCAIWTVMTMCDPDEAEQVTDLMISAHGDLESNRPLEDREIRTARRALVGSLALGLESTQMRANWLGRNFLAGRELSSYETTRSRFLEVTTDNVADLVRRMGEPSVTIIGKVSADE